MSDKKQRTAVFKGLNRMPYIGDGEMRDMKNLSSGAYPFITTRKGRKPYTFITKIPSPEGEAYKDIERLPEPCMEEDGNIYKVTTDAVEPEYVSGGFYYYNGETWVEGKKEKELHGVTDVAGEDYLIDSAHTRHERVGQRYTYYAGNSSYSSCKFYSQTLEKSPLISSEISGFETNYVYRGTRTKYTGESTASFKKGKTYVYTMYVRAYWSATTYDYNGALGNENAEIQTPTIALAAMKYYYRYSGESTAEFVNKTYYKCVVDSYCVWEECESQYDVVDAMPAEPATNQQVRFISQAHGAPMKKGYYLCETESDSSGEIIYFNSPSAKVEEYRTVGYLPNASAENEGLYFSYEGPETAGEFARGFFNGEFYGWEVVEHPQVERIVTLKDWLDNYEGSGLKKIIEIGNFRGGMAALIIDGKGECKLYYDEKLWKVSNISDEGGKKLITVGKYLIVGESGNYLHIKEKNEEGERTSEIEFFKTADKFSLSVPTENYYYGNGGEKVKEWEAWGDENGNAYFKIYVSHKDGNEEKMSLLKELAELLKKSGTGFSVYRKNAESNKKTNKKYLTVESVLYEQKKLISAWLWGSDNWEYDYADVLIIKATGASEEFDWHTNFNEILVFESTAPHYHDVVAWKKRLWGYQDNVLFGTVQDIFNSFGVVDWNTGDNTYTEAISQPLWQGGDVTGVAALMNGLVYFKEDSITVIQGNYPAVMSSNTIPCRGLPPENRRTVAVGNEAVYYLGRSGVMRFDGGIPRCISQEAKISGTDAVGFSDGAKYYLSLKETDENYVLYVYDITYGTWHKEECAGAVSFVMLNGELHMAEENEIYNLYSPQEDVLWEFELWYDEGTHNRKKYKEITVRGDVGDDCELWLRADDGEWKFIGAVADKLRIKLIPFDCEELSLKLKGKGKCEIKSIDRVFEIVE